MMSNNINFGNANSGLQAGVIHGSVQLPPHHRHASGNHIGPGATVNQGDISGNTFNIHLPHRLAASRSTARVIPYPHNPDFVRRPDLVDKLDGLLPLGEHYKSAALWGLGGSGYGLCRYCDIAKITLSFR